MITNSPAFSSGTVQWLLVVVYLVDISPLIAPSFQDCYLRPPAIIHDLTAATHKLSNESEKTEKHDYWSISAT